MFKILSIVLSLNAPTVSTTIHDGPHPMVSRSGRDRYSVIGEGMLRTDHCSIKAESMSSIVETDVKGTRWISFYDRDGELETSCRIVR